MESAGSSQGCLSDDYTLAMIMQKEFSLSGLRERKRSVVYGEKAQRNRSSSTHSADTAVSSQASVNGARKGRNPIKTDKRRKKKAVRHPVTKREDSASDDEDNVNDDSTVPVRGRGRGRGRGSGRGRSGRRGGSVSRSRGGSIRGRGRGRPAAVKKETVAVRGRGRGRGKGRSALFGKKKAAGSDSAGMDPVVDVKKDDDEEQDFPDISSSSSSSYEDSSDEMEFGESSDSEMSDPNEERTENKMENKKKEKLSKKEERKMKKRRNKEKMNERVKMEEVADARDTSRAVAGKFRVNKRRRERIQFTNSALEMCLQDQRQVTSVSLQEEIDIWDEKLPKNPRKVDDLIRLEKGQEVMGKYKVHSSVTYDITQASSFAYRVISAENFKPYILRIEADNLSEGRNILSEITLLKKALSIHRVYVFGGPYLEHATVDPKKPESFTFYTQQYWPGPTLETIHQGFLHRDIVPSFRTVKFLLQQMNEVVCVLTECGMIFRRLSMKDIRLNLHTMRIFLDNKSVVGHAVDRAKIGHGWLGGLLYAPTAFHENPDGHVMSTCDSFEVIIWMVLSLFLKKLPWESLKNHRDIMEMKRMIVDSPGKSSTVPRSFLSALRYVLNVKNPDDFSIPCLCHLIAGLPDAGELDFLNVVEDSEKNRELGDLTLLETRLTRLQMLEQSVEQLTQNVALINHEEKARLADHEKARARARETARVDITVGIDRAA